MLGCLPPECVAGTQEVPILQALKCASQTTDRSPHIETAATPISRDAAGLTPTTIAPLQSPAWPGLTAL